MITRHCRPVSLLPFCGLVATAGAECALAKEFSFPLAQIGTVQVFRDAGTNAIAIASQMHVCQK
jgi:hypothetical protein